MAQNYNWYSSNEEQSAEERREQSARELRDTIRRTQTPIWEKPGYHGDIYDYDDDSSDGYAHSM
jgi:hypothetical protein